MVGVATMSACAAAPNSTGTYYKKADGKKGEELKTALCGIIYNRTEKTYNELWTAFKTTDVRADGKIWDMYSNITNYRPGTDQGGNYSKEGDCYNREHSFPSSWFGANTPMYTDLHHLYPTDGYVNNQRGNWPFGETSGEKYKSANGFSKLGSCTYPGYTGTVFEPNDEYKGDFARTYFYMVTCYEEKLSDWYTQNVESRPTLDGNTYPGLSSWQLKMLMEWAANDPVSEKEVKRNNTVYSIQKNRNPFIDYPGLEQYIWGDLKEVPFSYDDYNGDHEADQEPETYSTETVVAYGETFTLENGVHFKTDGAVTLESANSAVATVDGLNVNPVAVGTTTINVTYAEGRSYMASNSSFTLTVTAPVGKTTAGGGATATVFTETFSKCSGTGGNSGGWNGSVASNGLSDGTHTDNSGWTFDKGYVGDGCTRFGSSGGKGSATTPAIGTAGTLQLSFRAGAWSGDATTLLISVSAGSIDKESVTLVNGTFTTYTATITDATPSTRITFASAGSKNRFFLDDVIVSTTGVSLNATLNAAGYATICCAYPLDFSQVTDYSAWQMTSINADNVITFEQVTGSVRGGTGLLLKGENGTTGTIELSSVDSDNTLSDNLFFGTLAPTYLETSGVYYVLDGNTFKPCDAGTIAANCAYIPAEYVQGDNAFTFVFGVEDGVGEVNSESAIKEKRGGTVYDLSGRQVGSKERSAAVDKKNNRQLKKGVYIIGDKKVVVGE